MQRVQYHSFPVMTIGIIGGGQLGKMMVAEATKLGFEVIVLDPAPHSPAGRLAGSQIVAELTDPAALSEMVRASDITTYDLENIDTGILHTLAEEGHAIYPRPRLLEVIQDKLRQREALAGRGIPMPEYRGADEPSPEALAEFGYPLVQKLRRGGYDGRGVQVLRSPAEAGGALPGPSLLERLVSIDKELALMVARAPDGAVRAHPVVEMVFDPEANILDHLLAPARISSAVADEARELSIAAVEALGGIGIFGVELFLDTEGRLYLNELAPRPHNSGHYTIEACVTCQYEQHIRAIAGLPLGVTDQLTPAAMVNLLGAPEAHGTPRIEGLRNALAVPGCTVHIYGKSSVRPKRKMGHATVVAPDLETARARALEVRELITIRGEEAA
ncbi:MAG: 5-(carboxyamino)imidazole ribonucleotide synthase [Holophagales bacterium]|nr:5-(carboxyamino)imidazole ribonucleotide synthase [Holophagales bacterium]